MASERESLRLPGPSASTARRYLVKPGMASHWAVFTEDGDPVFSDRDYRNPREALEELGRLARSEGMLMIPTTLADKSVDVEFKPRPPAELTLTLPPAAAAAVDRVLIETGDPPGEMFRKALGLYMLALDARKRGKVVGSADSTDVLETEFTGF